MSFNTINACANDSAFQARLNACLAQEQRARDEEVNPWTLLPSMSWAVASASDIEAAYASALAANNPNPGGDEAVVTDQMILSATQASWPTAP